MKVAVYTAKTGGLEAAREGGKRRPQRPPLLLLPEKDGEEKKRRKVNKLGGRERASFLSSLRPSLSGELISRRILS